MNVPAYYSPAHPHKNFFMITEKKKNFFQEKPLFHWVKMSFSYRLSLNYAGHEKNHLSNTCRW